MARLSSKGCLIHHRASSSNKRSANSQPEEAFAAGILPKRLLLLSPCGEFARNVTFLILRKLTSSLPSCSVPVDHWKLPKDLFLADPEFNRSSDVDLILGSQHFFDCFPTAARIQLSDSLPILVDSEFGWIVAGGAHLVPSSMDSVCCKTVTVSVDPLEKCMEKFWSVEELPIRSAFSVEEKACEDYYVSTVSRTQEGRYVVRYPKRENFSTMIGESKSTALRRFSMLEGRFSKNPGLQESYESFMADTCSSSFGTIGERSTSKNSNATPPDAAPTMKYNLAD
nr:uncharacterized protein LOC115265671 [Aedes albopictus]